jgi:hypothetical protein
MQNLKEHLRRFLSKNELDELMMRKTSSLEAKMLSSKIMMRIDISLTKMMRTLEMMKWISLLMFERQRNLQQMEQPNDPLLKAIRLPRR